MVETVLAKASFTYTYKYLTIKHNNPKSTHYILRILRNNNNTAVYFHRYRLDVDIENVLNVRYLQRFFFALRNKPGVAVI